MVSADGLALGYRELRVILPAFAPRSSPPNNVVPHLHDTAVLEHTADLIALVAED